MQLRDYQQNAVDAVAQAHAVGLTPLVVLPTGAGKTICFTEILRAQTVPAIAIAHRQELVTQMSLTLARNDVRHQIIAPDNVIREAVKLHVAELGRSFYSPTATVATAGVDTLLRRADRPGFNAYANSVGLWVIDEAHHVIRDNKWGTATQLFPAARGLGVTATPDRADGLGLGRHADGVFDTMIQGPTMRELINRGYLTDYRIFAPPSDLDIGGVKVSATTGDYNRDGVRKAVARSHIVGDVVSHYQRIATGKLGVTFAVDVESAEAIAEAFNAAGIPAMVVSAKTPALERSDAIRRFARREIMQLVNVDLFGEGFDLPAIEVVSMARPTQSYALFAQQFGRALRLMDGKTEALIIDHVGNVMRHGLPDARNTWTLDGRDRRSRKGASDAIPVTTCTADGCFNVYERIHPACPFCGHEPKPAARSGPEFVDGDLTELDAETLAAMRGEVERVDGPFVPNSRQPEVGQMAARKRHRLTQEAQTELRAVIAQWAGYRRAEGETDRQIYRRFYHSFGVDILTAKTLKQKEADALSARIQGVL